MRLLEALHESVELRDDHVFVISWIADQCSSTEPWQIECVWHIFAGEFVTKCQLDTVVHVRLVIGTTSVQIVEIESRRAEVSQTIRILLFGQDADRVEGQIMVNEPNPKLSVKVLFGQVGKLASWLSSICCDTSRLENTYVSENQNNFSWNYGLTAQSRCTKLEFHFLRPRAHQPAL